MSVNTTADDNLKKARSLLAEARDLLYETTQQECWGFDEFIKDYQRELKQAFLDVVKACDILNP